MDCIILGFLVVRYSLNFDTQLNYGEFIVIFDVPPAIKIRKLFGKLKPFKLLKFVVIAV